MFKKVLSFVKDRLFPIQCVECEAEGEWWCKKCRGKHKIDLVTSCSVCEEKNTRGEVCKKCQAVSALDGETALFIYSEKAPIGKLIRQLKYNYASDIIGACEGLINERQLIFPANATVMPVPLFKKRLRERGFNQAEELAKILSKTFNLKLDARWLTRERQTAQQAKLNRLERQQNVKAAFVWRGKEPAPEKVILVDDVFTTGATMQECAKALKSAGAKWVWGFTLARD